MHTGFVAPAGLAHSVQKSTVVSILHCTCKEPARAAEGLGRQGQSRLARRSRQFATQRHSLGIGRCGIAVT